MSETTTSKGVRRIAASDRIEGTATAGMTREVAVATERMWSGLVRTAPGVVSGWHHHGDYDTSVYVLDGAIHMEFGEHGHESIDGQPGDFLHVPPGTVHRESNPTDKESRAIVVRAGSGPSVVNVDSPD